MRPATIAILALVVGCRPEAGSEPAEVAPVASPEPARARAGSPAGPTSSVPDVPALVVKSDQSVGIEIYGAYIVDVSGEVGTRMLWPHHLDCPGVTAPPHTIAGGGMLLLPPPTEAYALASCETTPLPPGDYVVRLDSGYTNDLYAAAAVTLPLTGPVELSMTSHPEPACDPVRARRAARLALRAANAEGGLPPGFERECDVEQARCGALPLPDPAPPPEACTITLHERLLRIERAAGDDAPRWLTAWTDHEVVWVQRPEARRTSASRVLVEGEPVVIAGLPDHQRHEHGGDAARIGHATFLVHNPLSRSVKLKVRGIEFLRDYQCAMPEEVRARPRPAPGTPSEVAPGTHEVVVGFAAQEAYQSHCDRFATRVSFEIEGKRVAATVEHEVMRFEPLRHH